MTTLLLFFFKFNLITCAIMVPNSLNPIHSILFFILAVCNLSAILLLLKIGFLAFMFFIVYIGAISVLFLFIIMLLNIRILDLKENILNYLPINLTIAFLIAITFTNIFYREINPIEINQNIKEWSERLNEITDVESLGLLFYTYYYYLFFVIALILLIAMISSIMLTLSHKKLVRRQDLFNQINKSFEKTIILIKNNIRDNEVLPNSLAGDIKLSKSRIGANPITSFTKFE